MQRFIRRLIVSTVSILLFAVSSANVTFAGTIGSNLVSNSSFELEDNNMPIDWNVEIKGQHDGTFSIYRDPQSGTGSALMEATTIIPSASNDHEIKLNHTSISVKPNTVYMISYSYKSDISSPVILDVTTMSGPNDYPYLGQNDPTDGLWSEKVFYYKTSNAQSLFMNLYLRDNGYLQVDDVNIIETDLSKIPGSNSGSSGSGKGSSGRVLGENSRDFEDVPRSYAFYKYIKGLREAKVIKGYTDDIFKPEENITRAQLAKMIVLGFRFRIDISTDGDQGIRFTDVEENSEFDSYIHTLKNMWIVGGKDGKFRPDEYVTRGEASKMLVGALIWKGINFEGKTYENNFSDIQENNTFYKEIGILSNFKISGETIAKGYSDGEFKASEYITRGQISKLVYLGIQAGI